MLASGDQWRSGKIGRSGRSGHLQELALDVRVKLWEVLLHEELPRVVVLREEEAVREDVS